MFSIDLNDATDDQMSKAKKLLKKTSGCLLLIEGDNRRYNHMKSAMQLNMAIGTNNYLDLLEEMMNIMNTHQQAKKYNHGKQSSKENSTAMNFAQKDAGGNTDLSHIMCYNCREQGQYARSCPKKKEKSNMFIVMFMKDGNMMKMTMWNILTIRQMDQMSGINGCLSAKAPLIYSRTSHSSKTFMQC